MLQPTLSRKIGLWTTVSLVAGSIIGSSIFMKPAIMAGQLGSPLLLVGVWIAAGLISLMGAAVNAEIGAMLPVTGGQYVFFQKMYGNFFAYLYGWAAFAVINTASIASIAFIFSQYAETFVSLPRFSQGVEQSIHWYIPFIGKLYPLENAGVKTLTIILIVVLTWVNCRSVKAGGRVQVLFSAAKIMALVLMVCMLFFSGKGDVAHFTEPSSTIHLSGTALVAGIIAAMSGAFAAYDGWNNISFVAGEIKEPGRNIPKGLFIGLVTCIILYVITNLAYLYILPVDTMAGSSLVATDALTPVAGNAGAGLIALLVMVSSLGCTNGNILACARVSFEMSRQGCFFASTGKVHPKYQTPANALWLHTLVSCLFVVSGSFDMLTDLFIFVTWIFYGFGAYGIFILRRKMPAAERPYKVHGYPWLPLVFVLFTAFYFVMTLYTDISNYVSGKTQFISSVFGLLLVLAGVPLYFYFRMKRKEAGNSSTTAA
ncbi:MAG TPA: amino acid permease [Ferruginibacter sp.]|nr:amino acid permease [Ferruginibacter sp.]HPH89453.1 amino acid permease [Ferruginibacter sp.]